MAGYQKNRQFKRLRLVGQGVIEYAGALVIAAVIVATSIFIVPPSFAGFMNSVYASMATFFESQMPK